MSRIRRHVVVQGRVQGVSFRWTCKEAADRLGVAGWVRNRPDGTVEVVAEGDETAVDELLAWCRRGPRHAVVSDVQVSIEQPLGDVGFAINT